MTVVNTKSTLITNADAQPTGFNNQSVDGGKLRVKSATVEVKAADSDTSVYRFCRLPSTAVIHSVKVWSDSITGGDDYDFGVHQTADNGGAVANVNLFGDDIDLSSGTTGTELLYESGDVNIDDAGKQLWELLGLTSDPHRLYDITATGVTVGTADGTILLVVQYSDNS